MIGDGETNNRKKKITFSNCTEERIYMDDFYSEIMREKKSTRF